MGVAAPASFGGGDPALQPRHRLGGGFGRDLGAAAVCGRRARVHLGSDQRVAGALGSDPSGAGSGRLRQSQSAHRRDARFRGDPSRGAEWDQRNGRESGAAAHGRGLRPDPPALGVAAHGGPDGPPAYPSRLVEVVPDRSRRDDETTSDSLAVRVLGIATPSKGMGTSYSALVVLAASALVAILRSVVATGKIKRVNRKRAPT